MSAVLLRILVKRNNSAQKMRKKHIFLKELFKSTQESKKEKLIINCNQKNNKNYNKYIFMK